jgi:hypothetical protein
MMTKVKSLGMLLLCYGINDLLISVALLLNRMILPGRPAVQRLPVDALTILLEFTRSRSVILHLTVFRKMCSSSY